MTRYADHFDKPILLHYTGAIPSMKNSREPITVGKGPRKRTIYRKNDQVMRVMRELAGLAQEVRENIWKGQTMPAKTPFVLQLHVFAPDYNLPDIDGSANTVLDALQDVLYKDDKYCVRLECEKFIQAESLGISAFIGIYLFDVWLFGEKGS